MLHIEWLSQLPYLEALELQKQLVDQRRQAPELADKLLLLEHPHTYTFGSRGLAENLLIDEATLTTLGASVHRVGRGGDITYHGPGQLVGYPILNLKRLHKTRGLDRPDLHLYIREIEEMLIQTLATWQIHGWRYPGYTGVWVDTPDGPAKIAAIGIRVSHKGITSHGFALNVMPQMHYFDNIIPCGIEEHSVTSMATLLGRTITVTEVLSSLQETFKTVFRYDRHLTTYEHPTLHYPLIT